MPALQALLTEWAIQLRSLDPRAAAAGAAHPARHATLALTQHAAEHLLHLAATSDSLLSFVAHSLAMHPARVLDALMSCDGVLPATVAQAVHSLLYKLLGDSDFKYALGLGFTAHYAKFVQRLMDDDPGEMDAEASILQSFSVQIFTVPPLVLRLATEAGLLRMLVSTLEMVLRGRSDSAAPHDTSVLESRHYWRVSDDLRYVLSHPPVAEYFIRDEPTLLGHWLALLSKVQGMAPHTRETGAHIEMESDSADPVLPPTPG